jgi:hypothetical protein
MGQRHSQQGFVPGFLPAYGASNAAKEKPARFRHAGFKVVHRLLGYRFCVCLRSLRCFGVIGATVFAFRCVAPGRPRPLRGSC